jgi:hypothetical protein
MNAHTFGEKNFLGGEDHLPGSDSFWLNLLWLESAANLTVTEIRQWVKQKPGCGACATWEPSPSAPARSAFFPRWLGHVTGVVFIGAGAFHLNPASEIAADHLKRIPGATTVDEDFGSLMIYFTDATFEEITAHATRVDESTEAHERVLRHVRESFSVTA